MTKTDALISESIHADLLGPFLGHVTASSIKIWLHYEGPNDTVYLSFHPEKLDSPGAANAELTFRSANLHTNCVEVRGLQANTKYFYKLWTDPERSIALDLQGLDQKDLHFWTLSDDPNEQIDFVVMSCHNPDVSGADGFNGYAVWADLPQIIARDNNEKVRFALLVGDQVYADDWTEAVLQENDEKKRLNYYIDVYRHYWSNIHYRRAMCSLPAVMMWDDHDITDGWGSELTSFEGNTGEFKSNWKALFDAAFDSFSLMQASRNPEP